jgi:hypothetical protein
MRDRYSEYALGRTGKRNKLKAEKIIYIFLHFGLDKSLQSRYTLVIDVIEHIYHIYQRGVV